MLQPRALDNCAELITTGGLPKGDVDISGIGVILAFIISAYLTFATVLLAYLFGLVEEDLLNPLVDTRILGIRTRVSRHRIAYAATRKAVLSLSDQQIVTGIAIMAAGFRGLQNGEISVYVV